MLFVVIQHLSLARIRLAPRCFDNLRQALFDLVKILFSVA